MKVVVAGTRTFDDYELLKQVLSEPEHNITEIVSGRSKGADQLGERFAEENNIPLKLFPADWSNLGRKAGPIRNEQMAEYADALIAFWDGESGGTRNMISQMQKRKKLVHIILYKENLL